MSFEDMILWKTFLATELCEGNTLKSIWPTDAARQKPNEEQQNITIMEHELFLMSRMI